jgi:1-acyl-sn-glycerol-3-phosphate acyltransferase
MFMLQLMLLPKRVMYAPSDAVALTIGKRLPRMGFFPVDRGTLKGTRDFFKDCGYVLGLQNSVLCITPEGRFTDGRIRPLRLERGLAALLSRMEAVTVVPLAIEYTFWDGQRPELLTSWGEPICVANGKSKSTNEWQGILTDALTATMDELADLSQRREVWKFRPLIQGSMGFRNTKGLIGDLKALCKRDR